MLLKKSSVYTFSKLYKGSKRRLICYEINNSPITYFKEIETHTND